MSFLTTRSSFLYGTTVTKENLSLDFSEGGPQLNATLRVKSFSPSELIAEVLSAMNAVGGQVYTVALNRVTRKVTISAPGVFSLLPLTGTRSGSSIFETLGFDITFDKTGANTYTTEFTIGEYYTPQAVLQDYTSPDDHQLKESAKVNMAADGTVQTAVFGDGKRTDFNIWLITDKPGPFSSSNVEVQANAVQNTRDLLLFMITKGKFEFMPDRDSPSDFFKVICEKTAASSNGTGFKLDEMKAKDFYQTNKIELRVVT
jgi:hypothetical protein